jgi:hypothetical protein
VVRRLAHGIALALVVMIGARPIAALACDWACGAAAQAAAAHASHEHHQHSIHASHHATVTPLDRAPAIVALSGPCEDPLVVPIVLVSATASLAPPAIVTSRHEALASASIPIARLTTGHSPPATHLNALRI